MTETTSPAALPERPGVTGAVAIVYCIYGTCLIIAIALEGSLHGIPLQWIDAVVPVLLVITGVGVLLRRRWGRWLGYLVSIPLLFGVPIGTILGGYMMWHLTQYRRQFNR